MFINWSLPDLLQSSCLSSEQWCKTHFYASCILTCWCVIKAVWFLKRALEQGQWGEMEWRKEEKRTMLNLSFTKSVILCKSFSFKNPVLQMHADTRCLHLPCLLMSSWHYQPESWAVVEPSEQMSNGEGRMLFTEKIWKLREREENIQQEGGWEIKKKNHFRDYCERDWEQIHLHDKYDLGRKWWKGF